MKLAIILTCFYKDEIVERALKSLSAQTAKDNMHIYLVNDCSINTKDEYQSLIQKYADLDITYLKTNYNTKSCSIVRQLGIDNIEEQWFMIHEDDDYLYNEYVIENYLKAIREYSQYTSNIAMIKTSYIEQFDDNQYVYNSKDHYKLLAILYNKEFLTKFNLKFNNKLKRYEDFLFVYETIQTAKLNNYIIVNKDFYSYVFYHDKKMSSMSWQNYNEIKEYFKTDNFSLNLVNEIIYLAEFIKFHKQMKEIPAERIYDILKHIYSNSESILSLLEKYGNISLFNNQELQDCYNSWLFLIDLIEKNKINIEDTIMRFNVGENFQLIVYNNFKKTFKERFNKWRKQQ